MDSSERCPDFMLNQIRGGAKMSKIENPSQKGIFSTWNDAVSSYYSNVEKSIPQFHQASTNMYQEYVQALNNAVTSIIELQKEFVTKTGTKSILPDATMNIIHDSVEKLSRSFDIQNKITLSSIDAARQNIKTWNENSRAFANINKSIVDSCLSSINPNK